MKELVVISSSFDSYYDFLELLEATEHVAIFIANKGRITIDPSTDFPGDQTLHVEWATRLFDLVYTRGYNPKESWVPQFIWSLDKLLVPIYRLTGLTYLVQKYQEFMYIMAYKDAIKLYPKQREELLKRAERLDLLVRGGVILSMSDYKKGVC